MKHSDTFTCDGCGVQKGAANQWWLLLCGDLDETSLVIRPWNKERAEDKSLHHACGHACAHALLERYLSHRTLNKEEKSNAAKAADSKAV